MALSLAEFHRDIAGRLPLDSAKRATILRLAQKWDTAAGLSAALNLPTGGGH